MLLGSSYACGVLEVEIAGECVHKEIWPPHTVEIIAYGLIFIVCNLANATGVGGGGMLVPVLVLLMGFPAHNAIPLSKSIILGGAIISVLISLKAKLILIDFRIVSILQPMILLGTAIGVALNKVFPDWLIILLLTSTLGVVIYKNITKALNLYKQETGKIEAKGKEKIRDLDLNYSHDNIIEVTEVDEVENLPWLNISLISISYISVLLFALIKGGSGMGSVLGIEQCSTAYIAVSVFYMCYCACFTGFGYYLSASYLNWSLSKALCCISIALLGGIGSGMLGLGGGVILSPLLLDIGVSPEATAASSSLIVLFTSSSTTLQFFLGDSLNVPYAAIMFLISMFASLTGITFITRLVKKYKRPSLIVFLLAGVTAISAILLPMYAFTEMKSEDTFENFC